MARRSLYKPPMKNFLVLAMFLVGCTGADGRDGADGANGMNGMDGADGMDGMDGQDGTNGGMGVVRTIVVSPGATEVASGTALAAAIQDFVTNATKASATNRWLIKLEPGIYDVAATGINTVPFVDIEGSGENNTTIKGTVTTLTTDEDVEIKNLTVTCAGTNCTAVQNEDASPTFSNVTISATGLTSLSWAFGSTAGNPYLRDVTVIASGVDAQAIWLDAGIPFLRNVDAYATGSFTNAGPSALVALEGAPTVVDSTLTAVANPSTALAAAVYVQRETSTTTLDFDDVTIVASGSAAVGFFATSAVALDINVQDSTIKGGDFGIQLDDDTAITMFTANTMIAGGFDVGTNNANTLVCVHNYDDGFYALVDGDAFTNDVNGACTSTAP